MFAAQQGVKEAHDAFPPAVNLRAGLLISYLNASSKAFVAQRKIRFYTRQLVAKLTPRRRLKQASRKNLAEALEGPLRALRKQHAAPSLRRNHGFL
jgi:hypothetical protein